VKREHRRTKYEFGEGEFLSFGDEGPVGLIGYSSQAGDISIKEPGKISQARGWQDAEQGIEGMCTL